MAYGHERKCNCQLCFDDRDIDGWLFQNYVDYWRKEAAEKARKTAEQPVTRAARNHRKRRISP